MNKENKNVEEVVKEINPIDEYLNNYKEQKLAEFCVQKDKHIESLRRENHDYAKKLVEMKEKVEKYDETFENVKELYAEIKKLSVDDYLKLYHMISNDIYGKSGTLVTTATISDCGLVSNWGSTTAYSKI